MSDSDIYRCYEQSPFLSIKHSSYFQTYSELFEPYRNKPIIFVEIGILDGGSLFMWREFFGPSARIIGIELNPEATKWREHGFEIYTGSQSDKTFWQQFFSEIGQVDIVLDDGGHSYEQQIITVDQCMPYIKDNGLIVIEDTHTSYLKSYGYPSKYSFVEWTKFLIDEVNSRFPKVKKPKKHYHESIYNISFYESIVALKINRERCFTPQPTSNHADSVKAEDLAYLNSSLSKKGLLKRMSKQYPKAVKIPGFSVFVKLLIKPLVKYQAGKRLQKLQEYF